jgi:hypothetical protein
MNLDNRDGIPSVLEMKDLIPLERRPYSAVRHYLDCPVFTQERTQWQVIAMLAMGQACDALQPPLTAELADAVNAFNEHNSQGVSSNTHFLAANLLLDAVFEHGYRRDN